MKLISPLLALVISLNADLVLALDSITNGTASSPPTTTDALSTTTTTTKTLSAATTTTDAPSTTTLSSITASQSTNRSSAPAVSSPGDSARTPSAGVAPLNVSESAGVVSPTEATSIPSSAVPVDSTASSTEEDVALDPFLDIDKLASADHPIGGNNLTAVKTESNHQYYTSRFVSDGQAFWVDLNRRLPAHVVEHGLLSDSHRRAARVTLSFPFPFYGHRLKGVTVATGGFLYTGDYVHSYLAATQYIAPLMANFDTHNSPNSTIRYSDNGTSLTVQWENVVLQERPNATFTFQTTIHKSGVIVFAYRSVPFDVSSIATKQHPVKIGLSDAYIIDHILFLMNRKTIYEYHRIKMGENLVSNGTAIIFQPLPTCVSQYSCRDCLDRHRVAFQCSWCEALGGCSDGLDRGRQRWQQYNCNVHPVTDAAQCEDQHLPAAEIPGRDNQLTPASAGAHLLPGDSQLPHIKATTISDQAPNTVHSSMVAGLIIASIVLLVFAWLLYAYFYPHSTSGQILIRYRPSQWRLNRSEARYTAASIHM